VDVIADFAATSYPGSGGLSLDEVREALLVFVQQPELAAFEITAYNPAKDSDGQGAKLLVNLLADVFGARLETLKPEGATVSAPAARATAHDSEGIPSKENIPSQPATFSAGDAWSSDSLPESSDAGSVGGAGSEASDTDSHSAGASKEPSDSHS
jgi:hypothetical protein